jgi:hypothetical protein
MLKVFTADTPVDEELHARLNHDACAALKSKYEILKVITDLDNLEVLEEKISQFQDFVFEKNQRIVIILDDTQYYSSLTQGTGFFLHNLFQLLKGYNIPEFFVLLLTNHHGIEPEVEFLNKTTPYNLTNIILNDSIWVDGCPNPSTVDNIMNQNFNYNYEYLYSCVNHRHRRHRSYTVCRLANENLLDFGLVSLRRITPT